MLLRDVRFRRTARRTRRRDLRRPRRRSRRLRSQRQHGAHALADQHTGAERRQDGALGPEEDEARQPLAERWLGGGLVLHGMLRGRGRRLRKRGGPAEPARLTHWIERDSRYGIGVGAPSRSSPVNGSTVTVSSISLHLMVIVPDVSAVETFVAGL